MHKYDDEDDDFTMTADDALKSIEERDKAAREQTYWHQDITGFDYDDKEEYEEDVAA